MKGDVKYKIFLFLVFLAVWIWAAIDPLYRDGWLLENLLVFIFVPIIILAGFYFKLSNLSYTLITIFMILHVIGSHTTYAEVPFGFFLQDLFNSNRNMYDRLVHFCFGLLLFYPIREIFLRLSKTRGFWGFWFPVELTFALAAIYEIIEWLTAIFVDPAAGLAFLGSQGDVWDAQKDMLLAGLGAILSSVITFFVRFKYDRNLWREFVDSLKPRKNDEILGEVKLMELMKRK
jgi:putative membrane protein